MQVFLELSLILAITVFVSGIVKLCKQPLIIGYILSGIIVSPYFLGLVTSTSVMEVFSQIGVSFLLFIVGLSLSPKVIKEVGKVSLITGVGQIIFTSIFGFLLSILLGFDIITSLYISIALTFSSTIIIMKLLSDKKDLEKLYGKISVGFLLVQDLFVIVLLIVLSSMARGFTPESFSLLNIILVVSSVVLFALVSIYLLPKLTNFFAKSQEFLFLFSVGWGLGLSSIFYYLGFSMEIGALLAGISLSMSPFHYEISSKMSPLRDFFIIIFFVLLGSQMTFGNIETLIIPALIFSIFILIGNPLIVVALMGMMNYRKKIGFQAGLTVAQISEFSLIFITMGITIGHIMPEILSLVTLVGVATISCSTYLILYSEKIYPYLSRYLSIFEKTEAKLQAGSDEDNSHEIILFGKNRVGHDLLKSIKKLTKNFLVVDYNPETISELCTQKINCRYGDASDEEFLDSINLSDPKMIVSTIPDFETNVLLIRRIREENPDAIILVVSHDIGQAKRLYNFGATYVIMPHFLGGNYASMIIEDFKFNNSKFLKKKKSHLKELVIKKELGFEHPRIEKNKR